MQTALSDAADPGLAEVSIFEEDGRAIALILDPSLVSEAATIDDAVADLGLVLREYAEDWIARLHRAPNHGRAAALVEFIDRTTDAELREWLRRGGC